jgi:hypothetical protein
MGNLLKNDKDNGIILNDHSKNNSTIIEENKKDEQINSKQNVNKNKEIAKDEKLEDLFDSKLKEDINELKQLTTEANNILEINSNKNIIQQPEIKEIENIENIDKKIENGPILIETKEKLTENKKPMKKENTKKFLNEKPEYAEEIKQEFEDRLNYLLNKLDIISQISEIN